MESHVSRLELGHYKKATAMAPARICISLKAKVMSTQRGHEPRSVAIGKKGVLSSGAGEGLWLHQHSTSGNAGHLLG